MTNGDTLQARVKSYDSQWLVATQRTCLLYAVLLQVHYRCGKKPIDCTCVVVADWLINCILKARDHKGANIFDQPISYHMSYKDSLKLIS